MLRSSLWRKERAPWQGCELARLDRRLASQGRAEQAQVLQARARILSLSEALAQYGNYFDSRVQHMRFTDIDLFGVYVAPMSLMMVAAWLVTIALRQVADRFGLLRHVWHPALFVFAVFMIVLSSITLVVAR